MPELNSLARVKASVPDIRSSDEGAEAIYSLYAKGILSGVDSRLTFQPEGTFTRAEAAAICRMGLERMETDLAIRQEYLQKLREEFTQLKEKTDGHKTENL